MFTTPSPSEPWTILTNARNICDTLLQILFVVVQVLEKIE